MRHPGGDTGGEAGEPVVAGERAHGVQTQGAILPESAFEATIQYRGSSQAWRTCVAFKVTFGVAAFTGGEPVGACDAFGEERVEPPGTLGAQSVGEREVPLGDG